MLKRYDTDHRGADRDKAIAAPAGMDTTRSQWLEMLIDLLCESPWTRNLPGVRYLKPHPVETDAHHFIVRVPLDSIVTTEVAFKRAGHTLTVIAPGHHENGLPKLHWSEGTNGTGTWRRRYRLPESANPLTARLIPGKNGPEIVINRKSADHSLTA